MNRRLGLTSVALALVAATAGAFAYTRMKVDIFPPLNLPVVYVSQPYGGMDPQQMGRLTEALAGAHVRHTAELYVGALHGWTQTDAQVYDEAATERHWTRLLELFGRVLQP